MSDSMHLGSIDISRAACHAAQMSTSTHLGNIDVPHVTPPLKKRIEERKKMCKGA
jgi:hypothetical protein